MYKKYYQQGISAPIVIAVVAALVAVGGIAFYNMQPKEEIMIDKGEAMMEEGEDMIKEGEAMMEEGGDMMKEGEAMMEEMEGAMMHESDEGTMMDEGAMFTAKQLAGGEKAPLLEFNEDDYQKALASGKLVTLFFYANWCPICKEEFPKMQSAFDDLTTDNVVGFRVHYRDDAITPTQEALAKEYGVAYQHTKVFIKNGERILKSPESWGKEKFISEITRYAN